MRKYVIGFNGPPKSGKDTASIYAEQSLTKLGFRVRQMKYAGALKSVVTQFLGVPDKQEYIEQYKDQPILGYTLQPTLRKALIAFSEDFAKPVFGADVFGRIVAQQIAFDSDQAATVYVISDCGFEQEQYPVIDFVGQKEFAILQVHRVGHNFDGDSRSWVRLEKGLFGRIHNNGSLNDLKESVNNEVLRIVRAGGWYA